MFGEVIWVSECEPGEPANFRLECVVSQIESSQMEDEFSAAGIEHIEVGFSCLPKAQLSQAIASLEIDGCALLRRGCVARSKSDRDAILGGTANLGPFAPTLEVEWAQVLIL
jgi:hypothetical protein